MGLLQKSWTTFCFWLFLAKSLILDIWQDSEFASEASNNLRMKLHLSCLIGSLIILILFIFAKLFPISLLNLINMFHHVSLLWTVKFTWSYFQYICLITKIIIVFHYHVFLLDYDWFINRALLARWSILTHKYCHVRIKSLSEVYVCLLKARDFFTLRFYIYFTEW